MFIILYLIVFWYVNVISDLWKVGKSLIAKIWLRLFLTQITTDFAGLRS
jgi:hypothetical protein